MVLSLSLIVFVLIVLIVVQAFKIHAEQEERQMQAKRHESAVTVIRREVADFETKWHKARDENGRLVDECNRLRRKAKAPALPHKKGKKH